MTPPDVVAKERLGLEWRTLIAAAEDARQHAHAPYSHYAVGAAVRAASGRIYVGCNVENASYGLTVCAERVAMWNAVASGETEFESLVVVTKDGGTPCGACRQVMSELGPNMGVLVADTSGNTCETTVAGLLPHAFPGTSISDCVSGRTSKTG